MKNYLQSKTNPYESSTELSIIIISAKYGEGNLPRNVNILEDFDATSTS